MIKRVSMEFLRNNQIVMQMELVAYGSNLDASNENGFLGVVDPALGEPMAGRSSGVQRLKLFDHALRNDDIHEWRMKSGLILETSWSPSF